MMVRMTILSQNGWPANRSALITNVGVRGSTVVLPVRSGAVAVVFGEFAARFNREVETLRPGQCWGFAVRDVRGSDELSNHASGTAVDFNAPAHPLGKSGTFTAVRHAALRRLLADFVGVIRWGGDYNGRKDEMHFEIVASPGRVAALAARLRTPTPPMKDDDPVTPQEFVAGFKLALQDPQIRTELAEILWTEREFGRDPNRVTSEGLLVRASTDTKA